MAKSQTIAKVQDIRASPPLFLSYQQIGKYTLEVSAHHIQSILFATLWEIKPL